MEASGFCNMMPMVGIPGRQPQGRDYVMVRIPEGFGKIPEKLVLPDGKTAPLVDESGEGKVYTARHLMLKPTRGAGRHSLDADSTQEATVVFQDGEEQPISISVMTVH